MAAGDTIYAARYVKHPTVAIAGAVAVDLTPGAVSGVNQGAAGATGRAESLVTYRTLDALVRCIDTAYCLRTVDHGGALAGCVHARIIPGTRFSVNQGPAGALGPAEALVTYYELAVELYGIQYAELLALIGTAKGTLTLGVEGAAGADVTIALTNVYFTEPIPPISVPAVEGGGPLAVSGVRGYVQFGAAEVFADVITAAGQADWLAALAKIGAAAANLVIGTEGAAGTNEKLTLKNCIFVEPPAPLEIPAVEAGGPLRPFAIRGICEWGAADTFATMIAPAADM